MDEDFLVGSLPEEITSPVIHNRTNIPPNTPKNTQSTTPTDTSVRANNPTQILTPEDTRPRNESRFAYLNEFGRKINVQRNLKLKNMLNFLIEF